MHGVTFHLAPCQCSSPSTSICLQVFLCLVEGCARKFCTVEERKQHLTGGAVWEGVQVACTGASRGAKLGLV